MNHDSTQSNLSTDLSLPDEFDPFQDHESLDDQDYDGKIMEYLGSEESAQKKEVVVDNRPASEKVPELLDRMPSQRKILLRAIAFCEEPQPVSDLNKLINDYQTDNFSVFTAASLSSLLERAGALERITADGTPADEVATESKTVVIDGVEYIEAASPVEIYWKATEDGLNAVAADKPVERMMACFESDEIYKPIYKRILTICSAEAGSSVSNINSHVDNDPLLQNPRLYATYFLDKLEECDAVAWKSKSWQITEIGLKGLELLADVVDQTIVTADATTSAEEA